MQSEQVDMANQFSSPKIKIIKRERKKSNTPPEKIEDSKYVQRL